MLSEEWIFECVNTYIGWALTFLTGKSYSEPNVEFEQSHLLHMA